MYFAIPIPLYTGEQLSLNILTRVWNSEEENLDFSTLFPFTGSPWVCSGSVVFH